MTEAVWRIVFVIRNWLECIVPTETASKLQIAGLGGQTYMLFTMFALVGLALSWGGNADLSAISGVCTLLCYSWMLWSEVAMQILSFYGVLFWSRVAI